MRILPWLPFPWSMGFTFGRLHRRFWNSQSSSAEQLKELQLKEIQRVTLLAASTVPAYREFFNFMGDFEQIPFTTKEAVRKRSEAYRNQTIPESKIVSHWTSGSTGTPLHVFSTKETWTAERAVMYRGWRWAGFKPRDRVVTCVGALQEPMVRYQTQLDLSSDHLDAGNMERFFNAIVEFNPHFIRTYPTIAWTLGKYFESKGKNLPLLKGIWTQSETLSPAMRPALSRLWGCPVRDFYGMQEKCVAMSECEEGTLHVHSDFGYVELIPSAFPPFHRIVATGFWNSAMPLLRYETGDLAIPASGPCACGRAFPTIERIEGRIEDILISPEGKIIQELDRVVVQARNVEQCQFIQERKDQIRVRMIPAPNYSEEDERLFLKRIMEKTGPTIKLLIEKVTSMPRTSTGKFRFVVSEIRP